MIPWRGERSLVSGKRKRIPCKIRFLPHHTQPEREAEIQPDDVADDLGWEPIRGPNGPPTERWAFMPFDGLLRTAIEAISA